MFTASSTPNQIEIDAQRVGDRRQQRHDDEGELEEVEEERQHEDDEVGDDQEAQRAARDRGQQVLHPEMRR